MTSPHGITNYPLPPELQPSTRTKARQRSVFAEPPEEPGHLGCANTPGAAHFHTSLATTNTPFDFHCHLGRAQNTPMFKEVLEE